MSTIEKQKAGAETVPPLFYKMPTRNVADAATLEAGTGFDDIRLNDNIQAVIFDLDGSLMDSMWVWGRIDIEYLHRFGCQVPPNLQQEIGGMSMKETAVFFQKRFGITDSIDRMQADWNQMAWTHYTTDVYPKKGAIALLDACQKRGIPCAIASSNSKELVDAVLDRRQMTNDFQVVVTGNEVAHGKPAPDIYLAAARQLHAEPTSCLVFEDIPDGLRAAHAAGMRCIAVYDPLSSRQEPEIRRNCDGYIQDFTHIRFSD